ncbi:hypothetical protein [Methylacidimicrobium sp. B4]|uniref:hypothetical protein n=1 Tax=Methylacidimicrobium sp. B4 TaxID=2796139 RepID=UPI001A8F592C|nr:hypothetical protein [Methylacidimicrobium sp. B4]QSR85367.1 hypothetical protein MacB4_03740 [Methylacidimicrobium sp. B4]
MATALVATLLRATQPGGRPFGRRTILASVPSPWPAVVVGLVGLLWLLDARPGWADVEGASRRQYLGNWLEAAEDGNPGAASGRASSASAGPVRLGPHFWIDRWLTHSEIARSQEQPIWPAAMVTQTPRLEEYMQYSQGWQQSPGGIQATQYAAPFTGIKNILGDNLALALSPPMYATNVGGPGTNGFGDAAAFLKYRIASANEENGNYAVSVILLTEAPIGPMPVSTGAWIFDPFFVVGKGWGHFDIQSGVDVAIPTGLSSELGTPASLRVAMQYNWLTYLWPTLEVFSTYWANGPYSGETQVVLMPELEIGYVPIPGTRYMVVLGVGYEIAVTEPAIFHHAWDLMFRFYY